LAIICLSLFIGASLRWCFAFFKELMFEVVVRVGWSKCSLVCGEYSAVVVIQGSGLAVHKKVRTLAGAF